MGHEADRDYSYRKNPDGTVDSICLRCFHTVGTAYDQDALFASELTHRCLEEDIRHYQRSTSRLIRWPDSTSQDRK